MLLENAGQVGANEIEREQIGKQVFPALPVRQERLPRERRQQQADQETDPDGEQVGRHDAVQTFPEKDAVVGRAQVAEHD